MRVIEDEKLETVHKQTVEFPYKMQIVSLVIFVALIFLPFGMDKMDLVNHTQTPQLLYPFTVLFSGLVQQNFLFFYVSCLKWYFQNSTFSTH